MGAEPVLGQSSIAEMWPVANPPHPMWPPPYNGEGGAALGDSAVGTQTVNMKVDNVARPVTFVAGRTYIEGNWGGGWTLVIKRYDYATGDCIGDASCSQSFLHPGQPSATDYFVPVAMKVVQETEHDEPEKTYVLVTGYSSAPDTGNTDFRTVCFNGNLVVRWDQKFTAPIALETALQVDEYPVDLSIWPGTNVACVTGNTFNGFNWDVVTVFHQISNGKAVNWEVEASTNGNDLAAGCWNHMVMDQISGETGVAYVVATMNDGVMGNSLKAFKYRAVSGAWERFEIEYPAPSEHSVVKANAMDGINDGVVRDYAVGVGRVSGVDTVYMLTVKFNFTSVSPPVWGAAYNARGQDPGYNEALAVTIHPTTEIPESFGDFIAVAGNGYRDSSRGRDSLVCLYMGEDLRWSAWLNKEQNDPVVDIFDTCTGVAMDVKDASQVNDSNGYRVYVMGQSPVAAGDVDWRVAVFTSQDTAEPETPTLKAVDGNAILNLTGFPTGIDRPMKMQLNPPIAGDSAHNFVVTGNVFNGTTNGDDIVTRKYRYTPAP